MRTLLDELCGPTPTPELPDDALDVAGIIECTGTEFARKIVQSREYRMALITRVIQGELPPAVEIRLLDLAFGKPPDHVEHTGRDGEPIKTITEVRRVIVHAEDYDEESKQVYVTH